MSPKDYIKARQDSLGSTVASSQHDESKRGDERQSYYVAWIAGRPYVPELSITTMDDAKRVAARLIELNLMVVSNNNKQQQDTITVEEGKTTENLRDDEKITIDPDSLSVTTISGGRTNTLYLVSGLDQHYRAMASSQHTTTSSSGALPDEVLVRVFGAEGMIDRDTENASYAALSAAGIAPPYYGRFANGRLEGWMHGMRPLQLHELPLAARGIATQLARLHTQFGIPTELLGDTSSTDGVVGGGAQRQLQQQQPEPNLFSDLDLWMEQALRQTTSRADTSSVAQQEQIQSLQLQDKVRPELDWLKEQVAIVTANAASAICFCHNDILASNVLIADEVQSSNNNAETKPEENIIQLIDFEYGGVNYRAFDIANHFNEYAGGPPDLAVPNYELRPSLEQQRAFVRTYLETAALSEDESVTEPQVDALLREIQIFVLANHLYWGLWAVNQAATEGCTEYDYMLYAVNRIRQYWIDKEEQF